MYRRWGFVRLLKLLFIRFVRLKGTPHEVSRGIALGIAIGLTPTFGFQMLLGALAAWILRESKVAAILGVWITNPVTAPFIYALEYETGRTMLQMEHARLPAEFTFEALSRLGWDVLVPLCLGSLVWAMIGWILAYYFCLQLAPLARRIHISRWPRPKRKT
ncbi:hypothetical protein EDC39_102154 [Geothermobacter ehrlichii]|uniref:DUF2062 domain-containing protein n=1 Tax=Geothermobacter ehrlichii TaxID=213224 RepID=A0A5D3WPL9_9BACT|nr:DUF2062 domain-containing protein [Geothermobacter ehrlichii]TYO99631.1 hypothetical protein EDC39_102154 [Geothermobacter ehrlichii]